MPNAMNNHNLGKVEIEATKVTKGDVPAKSKGVHGLVWKVLTWQDSTMTEHVSSGPCVGLPEISMTSNF